MSTPLGHLVPWTLGVVVCIHLAAATLIERPHYTGWCICLNEIYQQRFEMLKCNRPHYLIRDSIRQRERLRLWMLALRVLSA